jgi:hypothetical protein
MQKNIVFLLALLAFQACQSPSSAPEPARWLRGNLHTHSLWSDGDDFPEMIMDWYKTNGYQFVVLSDHNILQEGEKWILALDGSRRSEALAKYRDQFGDEWVETRPADTTGVEVRLKTLTEYRSRFESPDNFLLLKSEEITDGYDGKHIHINATNIVEYIEPQGGNSVAEVMQNNIDAVIAQRERTGQPMFPHINHPNFGWAITADDMKKLDKERFFEVYNGHPMVHNYGDSTRSSTEEMWDEINAFYLMMDKPLLYGLATDDSHNYHRQGPKESNSGRGWVMVRSNELSAEAIIAAMEAGQFYASTGVRLEEMGLDGKNYTVRIAAEEGVQYTTQFWGVREGGEQGELLAETAENPASYTLTGDELFVRAKVISSVLQPNPFREGDRMKAWTQPSLAK